MTYIEMPAVIQSALSDGRAFTNYMSTCEFENSLKQNFRVASESQYRQLLQGNAKLVNDHAKNYVQLTPYFGVSTCPQAASAHDQMINSMTRNR